MNIKKYTIPVFLQIIFMVSVWLVNPPVSFGAPACSGSIKCYHDLAVGCSSDFEIMPCYCSYGLCTANSVGCCAEGPPGCSGSCPGSGCTSCSSSSVVSCQGKDPGDACNGGTCVDDGGTGGDGCPTCDCDTGGGSPPTPTPTSVVVNCSVSGPARVMQGAPVLYDASMSNATELDLSYKAVDGSPNWTVIFDNKPANTAGTFTCPSVEDFALVCSTNNPATGNKCTGNPWCPGPPIMPIEFGTCGDPDCITGDWSASPNDTVKVTCVPPPTGSLSGWQPGWSAPPKTFPPSAPG